MADVAAACGNLLLDVAQLTHAGGRPSNQDALGSSYAGQLACFVVSDGVGGLQGGEIASQTVIEAVIGSFVREAAFGPQALHSYIENAAAELARRQSEQQELDGMSATVALLLIDCASRSALWGHVGDTRVYLFRENQVRHVTKDHSLVQQLVDAGYCEAGQLRGHPQRSTLCAALGVAGEHKAEVSAAPVLLQTGDAVLICTDGFWEWITEQEMEKVLESSTSAEQWLAAMVAIVDRNGTLSSVAPDNYTAFTIYVEDTKQ
ncbi:PP2C family protein-serine/threonine phosphatase [Noviherbaspirillum massiliense]|uniref:PP2C family protein-serine/threonine phosphatase n=1 Tax=Noviherbaspirillum massiliense TaxID=1465823 RepID=UPI0002F65DAE|nr:PP2C family serine/threonine-protein phosphatase [Noviherbaspirillum massiliense]